MTDPNVPNPAAWPAQPAYTPQPQRRSAFAGLPGAVITAAILWGLAGLIAVAGPIGAVVEANRTSQALAQSYMQADPLSGQLYGNLDSIASRMQAPWFGAVIFLGVIGLAGYVVVSIFVLRGSQVARIIATVLSGLSIFALLAMFVLGIPPLFQFLLTVAGAVLIWLPPSSAYFAAKQAARPRPVSHYPQYPAGPVA